MMLYITAEALTCSCGASCANTSKEAVRFKKRHPFKCAQRKVFTKQLAEGVKSVEGDEEFEYETR